MAYDPNVLRRAVDRLEGERRRRRVELDRLRDRVYGREPRLAQLFSDRIPVKFFFHFSHT